MHKDMIILLKKILISNNYIYYLGYIFYGTSIIIISIMVMMVSYSDLYKYNDTYSNKILNQKELVVEEYSANNNSKIINYNSTGNLEIQIDKYDFTSKDLNKIFDEQKYYISSVRDKKLVPNILINKFPKDFSLISTTKDKKSLFIRSLLPLIIMENNKIIETNKRIKKIYNGTFDYISRDEALWLKTICKL